MQTFLPYTSFSESARVIDNKRLWKQILEANQLINLIQNRKIKSNWRKHPCYRMWVEDGFALKTYRDYFVKEWLNRRLIDPPKLEIIHCLNEINLNWISEELCASHRAALLKKDFKHYKQFNWKEKPQIKYYWPK